MVSKFTLLSAGSIELKLPVLGKSYIRRYSDNLLRCVMNCKRAFFDYILCLVYNVLKCNWITCFHDIDENLTLFTRNYAMSRR